ncbi:uncharacterized protein LACBIDRAFT_323896 [Laccaria bicolor S238N-H82]|uniref:Predicted protein n=1 Tax=Laccaria bicolor (strain S238N-H82 / ATCC MYA-4686) TaxID=486041 RepID=B0CZZ8_LACBS|nr:uncharacterized protein LACBIDRAFT_323896 [Laccaria bicolor S238N-H82]EDR11740.1 predicted protein [Laccaria bicolor S238N-H82]|eukprot:XP_001877637.1 predicted protein [Laccaria bicolor S238N-H82]
MGNPIIKVRLPTPSPAQPSTPKRAPVAEPLITQESPRARTTHGSVAEPQATQVTANDKPIYYIPHPDEFIARRASFPHTTYVITKGEEVGLFSAWHDAAIRVQNIPAPKGRIQYILQSFPTFEAAFDVYAHAYNMRTLEPIPISGGRFDVPINRFFDDQPNSDGEWDSDSARADQDNCEGWVFADSDEEIQVHTSRAGTW